LGNGGLDPTDPPRRVGTDKGWTQVSVGGDHACGVLGSDVYCWGNNDFGQLGSNTPSSVNPVQVGAGTTWTKVCAGAQHSCALSTNDLYCWGSDDQGQLGDNDVTHTFKNMPTQVSGAWSDIVCGGAHTCALQTDGSLFCWGSNAFGQVDGITGPDSDPVTPPNGTWIGVTTHYDAPFQVTGTWDAIGAGDFVSCGIQTGTMKCWGSDDNGELGDGAPNLGTIVTVSGAQVWSSVKLGSDTTCGLTTSNEIYCWGFNDAGEIADGLTTSMNSDVPVLVVGSHNWTSFDLGAYHAVAIEGTTLWTWGYNGFDELSVPYTSLDHSSTPVKVEFPQ
jgi:alpha-tubulin suppressor-like RCC1 family protein